MSLRAALLLVLALSAIAVPLAEGTHTDAHGDWRFTDSAQFRAHGWTGDGAPASPFRPPPGTTSLIATSGYGIEFVGLQNLTIDLAGLTITGGAGHSDAIHLYGARNVTLSNATLETNRIGIHVRDSLDVVLAGNTAKTSGVGVYLESSHNVTLRDNRLSVNDKDVELRSSTRNTFTNNNLSVATGQFGLYFDDNTSYNNAIDTTNLVNAIPVRWYANLAGTPETPLVIPGDPQEITVDLPRMTNVAQIMLTNVSHVRLDNATAKAGSSAGIHVHASRGVELVGPIADGNGGNGIFIEMSQVTRISNASVRNNTGLGISLQSTNDTRIETSTFTGNAVGGLRAGAGTNATSLRRLTLASNAGGGVAAEGARNMTLEESDLTSDGAAEVRMSSTRDFVLRANRLTGAGSAGVSLISSVGRVEGNIIDGKTSAIAITSSTGNNFTDNVITLPRAAFGFSFDGVGSYDNAISPSNLVNGTPVRWYTNVVGPLALDALRVETQGITNVAQIMLYRSSNVTLTSPIAQNGTAAGIIAHISADVNLSSATATSNAAQGILLTESPRPRVLGSTASSNGGDGVKIVSAASALLENNIILANRGRGLAIESSGAPTFRGNAITNNVGAGLVLDRVGPGGAAADHNVIQSNAGGIVATQSTIGSLFANSLTSNGGDGISLSSVPVGARLDANIITNHTRNVRLANSGGTEFASNVVTMNAGQTGFQFDDVASYNVTLPPTNTVNGVAVRWYVNTNNITIPDARVELRGITNVAQVMLYRVANLTLTGAIASNGTRDGIYVLGSVDTRIQGAQVENNTRAGLMLEEGRDLRVNATVAVLNAQEGMVVKATVTRASIENSSVRLNKAGGISLAGSDPSLNANVLDSNSGTGIALSSVAFGNFTGNALSNHTRDVVLASTGAATFRHTNITILPGQTGWHFADVVSYTSRIDLTNAVNGVPMRWYAGEAPVNLTNVSVELRGITNVAQVMFFQANNATVENIRVANGTSHGILVMSGSGLRINGSHIDNNTGDGLRVEDSASVALRNSTSRDNGGHGVRGTRSGPFVIDNTSLVANQGAGARFDEGAPFVTATLAERNGGAGIEVARTSTANSSRNTLRANAQGGLSLDRPTLARVYDNEISDNGPFGIMLATAGGSNVSGNRLSNHTKGIELRDTEFAELHSNPITIGTGQVGLFFGDEKSYNNIVPTTNTVNGAPVHWYVALAGSEGNPVVLAGVRSEQRGITNVAQVMLYRSAYVRMPAPVAAQGMSHGIVLYRSSSIMIEDANTTNNTVSGVQLRSTQSTTIRNLSAQGSGIGVQFTDSPNNVVGAVNASGATVGVSLTDTASRDNRVDGIETNGTARGVTDNAWNGAGLTGNNVVLDAGAPKRAKIGASVSLGDTMVTYRLEASRITNQSVAWGDGAADVVSSAPVLLRPLHAYSAAGRYQVNLTATTADGLTLRDAVIVEVVPPLSEPRQLMATPVPRGMVLTWTAPEHDGAATVTKYRVYRSPAGITPVFLAEVSASSLGFNDSNLENGRTYAYQVAAVNVDGEGPKASTTATPVAAPGAPVKLTGSPRPGGAVLEWSGPLDTGGSPLGGYQIVRAVNGSAFGTVATIGNVTTYAVTGLTNGVSYTFAVRGFNVIGAGALSANVTVKPIGPPGPGRNVFVLAGDAAATIAWLPPGDDGGTPVTGYRIWRGASGQEPVQLPGVLAANASSYRDTGLSNGQRYLFSVSAVNAYGPGNRSAPAEGIPRAVDSLKPVIFGQSPSAGQLLSASPEIVTALFADNDGVVNDTVLVFVDGLEVVANVTSGGMSYVPQVPMLRGIHTVRIVARDIVGNEADESWSFRILSEAERIPVFAMSNISLEPERVAPGANVTGRVSVQNIGYSPGDLTVTVVFAGNVLAYEELSLAEGGSRDLFLEFQAPTVEGVYNITIGNETRSLTVAIGNESVSGQEDPIQGSLANASGPLRPVRGTPSPRPEGVDETPFPTLAVVGALVLVALCLRRKR